MPRDYLKDEDARNIRNHRIFERFLKRAIPNYSMAIIAHHITYLPVGGQPVEIPSADTLLFCPELMGAVFGDKAPGIMMILCNRPPEEREQVLSSFLDTQEIELAEAQAELEKVL